MSRIATAWGGSARSADWYDKNLINPHKRCVRCGRDFGHCCFYYAPRRAAALLVTPRVIQSVSQSTLSGESVW